MSAYPAREEHEDRHRFQYRTATGTILTSPARTTGVEADALPRARSRPPRKIEV